MKKLFTFLLCVALTLSLVSCGREKGVRFDELRAMGAEAAAEVVLEKLRRTPNGVVKYLELAGYSTEEAAEAASGVDWKGQAVIYACKYLENIYHHSYSGLIEALVEEGYSQEDAAYGVDNCGADWNEQAVKAAKNWIEECDHHISYKSTIHYLAQIADFTLEQATYGADNCGIDWKKQAAELAIECEKSGDTYFDVIDYLEYEGFTPEEVEYGAFIAFGH